MVEADEEEVKRAWSIASLACRNKERAVRRNNCSPPHRNDDVDDDDSDVVGGGVRDGDDDDDDDDDDAGDDGEEKGGRPVESGARERKRPLGGRPGGGEQRSRGAKATAARAGAWAQERCRAPRAAPGLAASAEHPGWRGGHQGGR